jgi:hypothetical protein
VADTDGQCEYQKDSNNLIVLTILGQV